MKKLIAVFCCGAMLLPLTSCGEKAVVQSQTAKTEITLSWWGNDARTEYTIEAMELFEKLNKLRSKYNCIRSVRGKGLLIGIEFDDTITAAGMREQLFTMGILVSAIGKSTIRLAPPLIITKAQANQFVKALDKILKNVQGPKNVFDKLKDAIPSKKQIKESAANVGNAKIDKLDQLGLTDGKDSKPADIDD